MDAETIFLYTHCTGDARYPTANQHISDSELKKHSYLALLTGVTKVIESSLSQTLYQLYTNPCHIMPDKSCSHVPVVPAAAKSAGICLVSKRWATGFCTDDRDAGQEKRRKLTAMAATAHVPTAAAQPDSQVVTSLGRARAACLS